MSRWSSRCRRARSCGVVRRAARSGAGALIAIIGSLPRWRALRGIELSVSERLADAARAPDVGHGAMERLRRVSRLLGRGGALLLELSAARGGLEHQLVKGRTGAFALHAASLHGRAQAAFMGSRQRSERRRPLWSEDGPVALNRRRSGESSD